MPELAPFSWLRAASRAHFAVAFGAYSALAIFLTLPLIAHLGSRLPGDLGDPLAVTSILWWNAAVTPLTAQWWDGFGFFPGRGMMAFSEHFLGASLIASPLQWLGAAPVTAYNVTLLLSYPLCGIAAYALVWRLTRRKDAALLCGLAYAFNPYRVAHLEHLELLLAFGLPAALLSLHAYAERRDWRWLVAFAGALALQVLSASYYGLFFTVLLGMWLLWFMRFRDWRDIAAIVGAGALACLLVAPVILGYLRIHDSYDLAREVTEVLTYSADITSLVTASARSAAWGWTSPLNGGERQLFPGLFVIVAIGAGAIWHVRHTTPALTRRRPVAAACWGVSIVFSGAALWVELIGTTAFNVGRVAVSLHQSYKPLSVAVAFACIGVILTDTFHRAWRRRSPFAFYLVAAVVLLACSLGPRPTFLGAQVLYEPPYAWLMRLPLFDDTIRVPARIAMLAVLALSVAASLAFNRVPMRWRTAALLTASAAILAEGWMTTVPLVPVPQQVFHIPGASQSAPVMELPLGDLWRDTAALYRATLHEARVVNGYNGFEPPFYQVLRRALEDHDPTILRTLAADGPLVIAADKQADPDRAWRRFLDEQKGMTKIADDERWTLFQLSPPPAAPAEPQCEGEPIRIVGARDRRGPIDAATLTDSDPDTRWITPAPQAANDEVTFDAGRVDTVCGVELSLGREAAFYPGALVAMGSADGGEWTEVFRGHLGGAAFRAALDDPSDVRLTLPIEATRLRYLRLRVEESQPHYPWAIADVVLIETGGS